MNAGIWMAGIHGNWSLLGPHSAAIMLKLRDKTFWLVRNVQDGD